MNKFEFAEKVAADFAGSDHRYAAFKVDPTFWDFLMKLFEQVLPLISGCFATPKQAAQSAMENTFIGRFRRSRLNREVKKELDDFGLEDELLTPVVDSILRVTAAS